MTNINRRRFPVLFSAMAALAALVLLLSQNPQVAYTQDGGRDYHTTFYLACPDTEILEGTTVTVYLRRVYRDVDNAEDVTMSTIWHTDDITATNDDYHGLSGNHQYSNKEQSGANTMPRTLQTKQDNLIEGNETFRVRIEKPQEYIADPDNPDRDDRCTITIIDEDLYITAMSVANRPRYGDTFGAGEEIKFRVTFSSWVEVEGDALFKFNMGDEQREAKFREMQDNFTLIFAYTVLWNDLDTDGVSIDSEPIGGSGTITYWRSDIVPYLKTFGNLQLADRAKVLGSPRVVGLDVSSNPVNGSTYGIGEHIELTLTFSEPVRVTGDVQIPIWVGDPEDSNSRRAAIYDRSTGTDTLVFRYEVAPGDRDDDGFTIRAGLHELQTFEGGGDILSVATQVRRDPIYSGQDDITGHKVDGALDLRLESLTVSGGSLSPEFSPQVTDYDVVFPRSVTRATIGGEADDDTTVSYGPDADADEVEAGYQVDLQPGKNGVTVTVAGALTSETREYTVTINRASSDATLRSLSLNRTAIPGFHPDASIYAMEMDAPVRVTTLDAAATDDKATVAFDVPDDDPDESGHQVVLNEGASSVTVTVTAEDRVNTRKYSLTFNVADARDDRGTTARATVDPEMNGARPIHYRGSVREAGDVDWIRAVLEADRMYRFSLMGSDSGAGGDLTLYSPLINGLYDADGQYIPGTLEVGNAGVSRNNARLHYMPVVAGDYYLAVRGVQEQSGTYALRVVVVPDDLLPDNESTPGAIAVNGVAQGAIDYRGDADWHRMELQRGVRYGAAILRLGKWRHPGVLVYDHMGQTIPMDYLDPTYWRHYQGTFTPEADGAYYLVAATYPYNWPTGDQGGYTGRYTLYLREDGLSITGALIVGETLTADTSGIRDEDGLTAAAYAYQWVRVNDDGTETQITGADDPTYTLTSDDEGKSIRVRASFTDDANRPETRFSAATIPVAASYVGMLWDVSVSAAVEGQPGVAVTVKLNKPLGRDVAIPIRVARNGGADAADYAGVPAGVTFDGDSETDDYGLPSETFIVTATDDDHADYGESLTLRFGDLPPEITLIGPPAITVKLVDNEMASNRNLVPPGLSAGDKFRLLFVTSGSRNAESSDIADYNAFVQDAAAERALLRPYSGAFRALGSTEAVNARDNTDTGTATGVGVPIYWLNGPEAADNYLDLYDGSWDHRDPGRNERGEEVDFGNDDFVWTGSASDGTGHTRALGTSQVQRGSPGGAAGDEITSGTTPNSTELPLYSLSFVLHVVEPLGPQIIPDDGLAVTSMPGGAENTYQVGEVIEITAEFSEAVQVVGDPEFGFDAGGPRLAGFVRGSGTKQLVFAYTVSGDERDDDGIWIGSSDDEDNPTFRLDEGDAITSVATGEHAVLDHPESGVQSGHKVDGSLGIEEVPRDWRLIPSGVDAGEYFRLFFVTAGKRSATSSDIAVYNSFVQAQAASGHDDVRAYSGRFAVLGSTEAVDARNNTRSTHTSDDKGVPIYWLNGPRAANDYADFYDRSWDHRDPGRNQRGEEVNFTESERISTGSNSDGTRAIALGGSRVTVGAPGHGNPGNAMNIGGVGISTGTHNKFYALSFVFQVEPPPGPRIVEGGVAITSIARGDAHSYVQGETIEITVTFDEAVQVAGTPQFAFDLDEGERLAEYLGGSGATQLVFGYTVKAGDDDDDGISIGDHSDTLRLDPGDAITGVATGEDVFWHHARLGAQTEHQVYDGGYVTDATLSNLALSGTTLEPHFYPARDDYTASVALAVSGATVTYQTTVTDTQLEAGEEIIVVVDPADADPNSEGHQVALKRGHNPITVTVTSVDERFTRTYVATVTRGTPPSADLSALTVDGSAIVGFDPDTTAYTQDVVHAVDRVTVAATAEEAGSAEVAYSPADVDPDTDDHQVDLELGDNPITVTVTAEDETTKEYTLTINRTLTGGAYLSALSAGGIGIEGFVATTPDYTVTVGNSIERATIALATVDGNASVTYSPADADSSAAGYQVDLEVGSNVVTITVTASEGATRDYTLTINRTGSDNANLRDLTSDGISLGLAPDWFILRTTINMTVGRTVQRLTLAAIPAHASASVSYSPADADPDADGHQVDLQAGANTVEATVTAENGFTTKTYTITINVTGGTNADLSDLAIEGTSVTDFAAATTGYTLQVENSTAQVTVAATAADAPFATVAYSPTADADTDTDGHQVDLAVGENAVIVTVTAQDGTTTKEYTLTISRAPDTTAPTVAFASVSEDGLTVTVVFNEDLDRSSDPSSPQVFAIFVGQTPALPSSAAISDTDADTVVLSLTGAIIAGETVRLNYVGNGGLQDESGNAVAAFTGHAVANRPAAPTATVAPTATHSQLTVSWDDPADGGSAITGYEVQWRADAQTWEQAEAAGQSGTGAARPHIITGLGGGVAHHVRVRLMNAAAFGPWSAEVSGTPQASSITVNFDAGEYAAIENGENAVVTVRLSQDPGSEVIVPIIATPVGETTPEDFSGVPESVTFDADSELDSDGRPFATFTVTATRDSDGDHGESLILRLGSLPAAVGAGTQYTANLYLQDRGMFLSWSPSQAYAIEGGPGVELKLFLDGSYPGRVITVPVVVTLNDGAEAADYSGVPESVSFDDDSELDSRNRPVARFTVTADDDAENDPDERLTLEFGDLPAGFSEAARDQATVFLVHVASVQEVASTWALVPSGLAGNEFRLLFVTSTSTQSISSNIADYNTFVQAAAAAGHTDIQDYSSHFAALGSTTTVNARDNTGTNHTDSDPGVPIYWLNGAKAADSYADFYDDSWDHRDPGRNENGAEVDFAEDSLIWTGSTSDGAAHSSSALGLVNIQVAKPGASSTGSEIDSEASADTAFGETQHPLYGLSYVLRVAETIERSTLPPPDNVRAVTQKSGAVALTWEAPDGAAVTGYRIDRRRAGEGLRNNHTLVEDTGSADTGYTDQSAEEGVDYEYRISARNESGPGEVSDWVRAVPEEEPVFGDGPPGAPGNLTVAAGDQEITLSWDPPADNGNPPATRYRIEWRMDGKDYKKGHWGTSGSTTYTKTDLANGVKYVFRVKAENGSGNSYGPYGPASEEVSATPTSGSAVDLGTPVLSNTETLHHGMVRLDWEDIENAGWYVVQYYHVKSGEWLDLPGAGVDIAFHGSSAVVSDLHGLSWLRVRAVSCAGASEWSQIEELYGTNASDWEAVPVPEVAEGDQIDPCPVTLGTPVLSGPENLHHGMVRLDWEDIEDAGWYVVQHYHVKSGEWLDLPAAGVDIAFHGSSAVVSNLHGLSWLRVRAVSCAGESEWSQIEQLFGTKESDWEDVPVPEVAEGDEIEPCSEEVATPDNSPATGEPAITGTVQVGETLTANTSGIADPDGLSNVQYEYQWLADDAEIAGATNATYTLVAADAGKAIKVRTSFTDDAGNEETLTSAATDAVAAAPTPNTPATGAPTINGTAQVGEALTADTSGIADADGLSNVQYEYQWLADDAEIAGATGSTHTLADTDEGKAISVSVSFTDDADNEETLTSGATEEAAARPNSLATGAPTISGTAQVGEALTADTSGIADADGLSNVQYEYQWLADNAEIAGATGSTHTLADTDEGKAIKVDVTFTDDADNEETLTSGATEAVAAAEPLEPPAKPTGLSATASHDQVVLTWDDPQDESITGYVILRRVRENDQGGEFSELVADTGTAAITYTDNTVAAGTTYTYRIKAINEHGVSERSRWSHIDIPAAPVPDKPTGLYATATHDSVTLTWDDPQNDSITGYVILRRLRHDDPEGHFDELAADTGTADTTYTDDTVAAGTSYTYRIKAINGAGPGERSRWYHIDTPAAP